MCNVEDIYYLSTEPFDRVMQLNMTPRIKYTYLYTVPVHEFSVKPPQSLVPGASPFPTEAVLILDSRF